MRIGVFIPCHVGTFEPEADTAKLVAAMTNEARRSE